MNAKDYSISSRAHQLWEAESKPDGKAQRHWQLAARLISGQKDQQDQKPRQDQDKHVDQDKRVDKGGQKRSTDPSEVKGPPEPEQPDQT